MVRLLRFARNDRYFFKDKKVLYFALVLVILFLVPYPKLRYRYFFEALSDASHLPLFILISLAAFFLFKEVKKTKLLIILLLLPALIEFIQPWFGRGDSIVDLVNGYWGIFLGVFFYYLRKNTITLRNIFLFCLVSLLCFIFVFAPVFKEFLVLQKQIGNFPVLFSEKFENEILDLWLTSNSGVTGRGNDVEVITQPNKFSGLEYKANGFDWSAYKKLIIKIDLINSDETLINIRIDDEKKCKEFTDRYNGQFKLLKGPNTLVILLDDVIHGPKNRLMDLSYVERMLVFTNPEESSIEFYINKVSLE